MTPNNVDSLARLGDSEVFAVKHTPADRIPELGQRPDDGAKISSTVRAKKTCNVFEQDNSGACFSNEASKVVKESRALPSKPRSRAHSSQRDVLAGESSSPNVGNRYGVCGEFFDVFMVWDSGPAVFEDCAAEFFYFALEGDFKTGAFEAEIKATDSTEKRRGAKARRIGSALVRAVLRRGSVGFSVCVFRHREGAP